MEPIIIAAEHTGMRQSELLTLKWQQVDFMNNVITLGKTKGKKVRLLPMNAVVVDTLLKLRAGSRDEFVFPIDRSEGDVRSKFKYHGGELCKKVGLSGFRFHDLRATFATRLDARGVGAFTIKALLGHSTMEVTKRYIGVDESSRRAVDTLASGQICGQNSVAPVDQTSQVM